MLAGLALPGSRRISRPALDPEAFRATQVLFQSSLWMQTLQIPSVIRLAPVAFGKISWL